MTTAALTALINVTRNRLQTARRASDQKAVRTLEASLSRYYGLLKMSWETGR